MLSAGLRRAELVPRQDIHDNRQNSDAGDADRVDDNPLVDHAAVPLRAVDTDTYKQLTNTRQTYTGQMSLIQKTGDSRAITCCDIERTCSIHTHDRAMFRNEVW